MPACSMPPGPAGPPGTAWRPRRSEAARHGAPVPRVDPITTADWPTKAKRPADLRLDCGKLEAVFGLRLPHWRDEPGPHDRRDLS